MRITKWHIKMALDLSIIFFILFFTSSDFDRLCGNFPEKVPKVYDESLMFRSIFCIGNIENNYSLNILDIKGLNEPFYPNIKEYTFEMMKMHSIHLIVFFSKFCLFLLILKDIFEGLILRYKNKLLDELKEYIDVITGICVFILIFSIVFASRTIWRIGV